MRNGGGGLVAQRQILVYGDAYPSLRLEAAKSQKPQTVLLEDPSSYGPVLKDIRSGFFPPGTIAVFDGSNDPDRVLATIDRPVERVHLLYNIPETLDEAVQVHGPRTFQDGTRQRGASVDELKHNLDSELKPIAAQLRAAGGVKIEPHSGESAKDFLEQYIRRLGPNDVVLIVSHVVRTDEEKPNPNGGTEFYPYVADATVETSYCPTQQGCAAKRTAASST
jgi:hypothetical protein